MIELKGSCSKLPLKGYSLGLHAEEPACAAGFMQMQGRDAVVCRQGTGVSVKLELVNDGVARVVASQVAPFPTPYKDVCF